MGRGGSGRGLGGWSGRVGWGGPGGGGGGGGAHALKAKRWSITGLPYLPLISL